MNNYTKDDERDLPVSSPTARFVLLPSKDGYILKHQNTTSIDARQGAWVLHHLK